MKKYYLIAIIILYCFFSVSADNGQGRADIEINLPSRILSLFIDGTLMKEYPVCVGKSPAETPQGEFRVVYKTTDPYWINGDVIVPPGPQNPLGKRWMGLSKTIGIHGNNKPESIGKYESAGCIRMYNRDVEELYAVVPVNTPVKIKYDRIEIFEDKYSGKRALVVYPDSYKSGNTGNEQLLQGLVDEGLTETVTDKAAELLKRSGKRPRAAADGIAIFLNERLVTFSAFEEQGKVFLDCRAAEEIFGLTAAVAEKLSIETSEAEDRVYVNLTQMMEKYGGNMEYEAAEAAVYISVKLIRINGTFAGLNLSDMDKEDILGLKAVKQLDYDYSEDSVDIRIFDRDIMKLKRGNTWGINTDNLVRALGGSSSIDSRSRTVDLTLPTFVRFQEEYFRTGTIDGKLVLDAETALYINTRSGMAGEVFWAEGEPPQQSVLLEHFLQNYEYSSNCFGTVIDVGIRDELSPEQVLE